MQDGLSAGWHAPATALASLDTAGFEVTRTLDSAIGSTLAGVSPVTYVLTLVAGLASSLSPCTLSVMPLTIGYIGGYAGIDERDTTSALARATTFGLGVASTLTLLGIVSANIGAAYGQTGTGNLLPIGVGLVAILMGLNLLEVLPLRFPTLDVDVRSLGLPPLAVAYAAGLTFALAASPCSTPILATLLAYTSTQDTAVVGASLLFVYSIGYVAPLLVAASAAEAAKQVVSIRKYSGWVTPASGVMLLAGGTYAILSRVVTV